SCFADIKFKNENIAFCLAKQSSHAGFADLCRFFINKIIFLSKKICVNLRESARKKHFAKQNLAIVIFILRFSET
ncbi:MAG: hypothetical protein AB8G11_13245, partial [Saprospiraceae bacterium]